MRDRGEEPPGGSAAPAGSVSDAAGGAAPGVESSRGERAPKRPVSVDTAEQARVSVLSGLRCASPQVGTLAEAVAALVEQDSFGDLGAGAQLG